MKKRTLHEGRFKRFVHEKGWEYVERVRPGGVVVILAVTNAHELVLVEQLRVPVGKKIIELPAGLANDLDAYRDESLVDAARRELLEETGYTAGIMKPFFMGPASAAVCDDVLTFFHASRLKKVSDGGGDDLEAITPHVVSLKNVEAWLKRKERSGCLIDPKIYMGLYFLAKKLGKPASF